MTNFLEVLMLQTAHMQHMCHRFDTTAKQMCLYNSSNSKRERERVRTRVRVCKHVCIHAGFFLYARYPE